MTSPGPKLPLELAELLDIRQLGQTNRTACLVKTPERQPPTGHPESEYLRHR